jgi:hypothetical protein
MMHEIDLEWGDRIFPTLFRSAARFSYQTTNQILMITNTAGWHILPKKNLVTICFSHKTRDVSRKSVLSRSSVNRVLSSVQLTLKTKRSLKVYFCLGFNILLLNSCHGLNISNILFI